MTIEDPQNSEVLSWREARLVTIGFDPERVTTTLPAGPHTFTFECAENTGNVALTDSTISAVLLGAS